MKRSPLQIGSFALVVLAFVIAAAAYPYLPEEIPTHWNAAGQIDDTTPKPLGPFLGPILLAVTWLVLAAVPRLSPRGFLIDDFRAVYDRIVFASLLFLFAVMQSSIAVAFGYAVPMTKLVFIGLGITLTLAGNYMGKMRRNFFIGIRTPWTLASEEVWLRTHRFGGRIFVVAGLIVLAFAFFAVHEVALVGVIAAAALIPIVYSYVVYRQLERSGQLEG